MRFLDRITGLGGLGGWIVLVRGRAYHAATEIRPASKAGSEPLYTQNIFAFEQVLFDEDGLVLVQQGEPRNDHRRFLNPIQNLADDRQSRYQVAVFFPFYEGRGRQPVTLPALEGLGGDLY